MHKDHTNHQCTHCSCNNPLLKIFSEEIKKHGNEFVTNKKLNQSLSNNQNKWLITAMNGKEMQATIRPVINGEATEKVEAIGIAEGRVVALGNEKDVNRFMTDNHGGFVTKMLEKGQALLPGLIEPHAHIVPTAFFGSWLDLSGFKGQDMREVYNLKWLKNAINEHANNDSFSPTKDWILGKEVDPSLMPFTKTSSGDKDLVTFNLEKLDDLSPCCPLLMLSASMHTFYANTSALVIIYEVNEDNPDFIKTFFKQDETPSLALFKEKTNGQLQEIDEMKWVKKAIPKTQVVQMLAHLKKNLDAIFETAPAKGITLIYDAGMDRLQKNILQAYMSFKGKGLVRVGAVQVCLNKQDVDKLPINDDHNKVLGNDIYVANVKLVSDGSNQGLTGYQEEPYCCPANPENGILNFSYGNLESGKPNFQQMVEGVVNKGWPLMIHANGNAAIEITLDVYENVLKNVDSNLWKRNRIEHCSVLTENQINRMKDWGISPSFLMGHVGYWGYAFKEVIFKEKAEKLDLCKSALNKGLRISLHSDMSVSSLGPLRLMEQSITRRLENSPEGKKYQEEMKTGQDTLELFEKIPVLNPKECLTPADALKAVTYYAAWQCNADQWVGSLAINKLADFVVLERDPLAVSGNTSVDMKSIYLKMRDIPVVETWKGGSNIYTNITSISKKNKPKKGFSKITTKD